jgi:uncharacterized membrane protein (DUF4010 family)
MLTSVDGLLLAALGGAAVGLEREWSGHATGPHAHFAGIRTFTLLGVLGGLAGKFMAAGWIAAAVVLLAAPAALVVVAYAAASPKDIDATTEVAAFVVLGAGALAGAGDAARGAGLVAGTTLLLLEKSRLHTLVASIDDVALRASARFAALALLVLPLLPSGSYGPFGAVRPRELWVLVLFFSGLSFAAWIGRRLLGPSQGVVVAGLLGGVISSTSVTLTFARMSRTGGGGRALALGSVGACTVMLVRVLIASAVLNPALARAFAPFTVLGVVIGVSTLAPAMIWRKSADDAEPPPPTSPLQLGAALRMTALFQVVMIGIAAVVAWWSVRALMVTSAMIGLTDLDALTLSLARGSGGLQPDVAARALAVGVISNTLLKMGVAVVVGRGNYRGIVVAVLGAMAAGVAVTLYVYGG